MGDLILGENLSSDPSSPPEGLFKRVNGTVKVADSNGNMQRIVSWEVGTSLPGSLSEGNGFLDVSQTEPILYVGPQGGGTPRSITEVNTTVVDLSWDPTVPRYDIVLKGYFDETVSLTKTGTGQFEGTVSRAPDVNVVSHATIADPQNSRWVFMKVDIRTNQDAFVTFTDNSASFVDMGILSRGGVMILQNSPNG